MLNPGEQDKAPSVKSRRSAVGWAWQIFRRNPGMIRSVLREEYRRRWGISLDRCYRQGRSSPPVSLILDLTRRCNLKCVMCEQHRHQPGNYTALSWYDPDRELPLAAWTKLLDQVSSFRPRVYITGGEPLVYPQITELLQEVKKRKLYLNLQTNGTFLNRIAGLLVAEGVEIVTVSLDGPPEVHDRIRGIEGAFRRTREGIAALAAARGPNASPLILINCVMSKANLSFLDRMVPLALELGADVLQFQHTMFNAPDNVERHNRWLSREFIQREGLDLILPSMPPGEFFESEIDAADLQQLRRGLETAQLQARGRLRLQFLPNLPADLLDPYYLDLEHPFPQVCQALWKSFRVLPDGTVSPCLHLLAGNITSQTFDEIWNGLQMQRFRQLISRRLFPGCARCCSRSFN
ncbi:MAG: radical SAM protein [Syntrophales bacterium]|nr:radical SAM protein [Syntrophales bacterium]MDD5641670.1 radical SAM protein [Syntrophales bacterium]